MRPNIVELLLTQLHRLHEELRLFVAYMTPTREEMALREDMVARFTKLLKRLAPGTVVSAVGSYVTKLNFPTSDVDMVISTGGASYNLAILESRIRSSGFAASIKSVLHASTPLLRITDAVTGLEIDLTADDGHGKRATEAVSSWLRRGDASTIRSLAMVLKMFLSIRRLGTTFTGGINSYVLVWMVVAYVKLEMPKAQRGRDSALESVIAGMSTLSMSGGTSNRDGMPDPDIPVDLGEALLGFLRFYGQDFNYTSHSIQFSSGTVLINYKSLSSISTLRSTPKRYMLHITDPADANIDMGAKAYGIKHVRETFRNAYAELSLVRSGSATQAGRTRAKEYGALAGFLGGDFSNFVSERSRIVRTWGGRGS